MLIFTGVNAYVSADGCAPTTLSNPYFPKKDPVTFDQANTIQIIGKRLYSVFIENQLLTTF